MSRSISLKSLIRLQKRQLSRGKMNKERAGLIFLILYFWGMEILFILLYKGLGGSVPPLYLTAFLLSALVTDIMMKIILIRDMSVMDSFLKTRPVSQEVWKRFLWVSQFWAVSNLIMPVAVLPALLLLFRFPLSIAVLLAMYLFSVLNGILVMLLKRRGPYASEKAVSPTSVRTFKSGRSGHSIFALQSRSLLRSSRLRTPMLIFFGLCLLQIFLNMSDQRREDDLWLLFFMIYGPVLFCQYGFGIESCCFSGLWTRPISVKRLLTDKFRLSFVLTGASLLIMIPIFLILGRSIFAPISYALFMAGFGSLLLLIDAYNVTPFDLFGKTFFNYQGSRASFRLSTFFSILFVIIICVVLPIILPGWPSYLILSGLGLLGIFFHRPYFGWVERNFLKNKYEYMDKYQSR